MYKTWTLIHAGRNAVATPDASDRVSTVTKGGATAKGEKKAVLCGAEREYR